MGVEIKEPWYLKVLEQVQTFQKRLDEEIEKQEEQLKVCKKKTELEIKLAQEMKLYDELTERLTELCRRGSALDRVCAAFETHLTIADSDQTRLDNAKENYQLAKELTGIRLDFSAPPDVAKGYIKSPARKLLQPFEFPAGDAESLWSLVQDTATPAWPNINQKENISNN